MAIFIRVYHTIWSNLNKVKYQERNLLLLGWASPSGWTMLSSNLIVLNSAASRTINRRERLPISTNKQSINRRHLFIMWFQMHKWYVLLHPEESMRQRGQKNARWPSVPPVLQIAIHSLQNTSVSLNLVVQKAIIHHHTWQKPPQAHYKHFWAVSIFLLCTYFIL